MPFAIPGRLRSRIETFRRRECIIVGTDSAPERALSAGETCACCSKSRGRLIDQRGAVVRIRGVVEDLNVLRPGGFASGTMRYRVAQLSRLLRNLENARSRIAEHLPILSLMKKETATAVPRDEEYSVHCGEARISRFESDTGTCSSSSVIPTTGGRRFLRLVGSVHLRQLRGSTFAGPALSSTGYGSYSTASDVARLDSGEKLETSDSAVDIQAKSMSPDFSVTTDDICYNCSLSRFQQGKSGKCPAHILRDMSSSMSDGLNGNASNGEIDDPTRKLKREFEAARRCFEHIPSALHGLPKMDPNGVYANHNLRLDRIGVYGFDYDYTLAHYTQNLQPLIYDLAKEHLVKEYKYPASCLKFEYDAGFPIRGLFYDKKKGYLLKLDFFHYVEPAGCFFGRRRMTRAEIEDAYGGKYINNEHMPNLVALMDLFCLSEACLISDVIQHFVDQGMEFDSAYVYEDVKRCISHVHQSGLMHQEVLRDPAKYLVKNGAVVEMLKGLKERGKKLFMLTNSPFPFVDGGMRFLFQEDGRDGETWRALFDVVIALADKPNFYTSERPFRYYNSRKDILTFKRVDQFQPHSVYYHGCLRNFLEITKWRGPEVLYFGDHLYSDLRGPLKAGWRTAAIIRELEREIETQNKNEYRFQQAKYHIVQELLGKYHSLQNQGASITGESGLLTALRHERQVSRLAMKSMFNTYFGSTFLTDTGKESSFSYNVQRYADVYTSRLENLMTYSSEAWLYTPFDVKILPHHIKVGPSRFLKGLAERTA